MSQESGSYVEGTKHPWPSFLLLVPLLALYEIGVVWFGGGQVNARTGADTLLRDFSQGAGAPNLHWPPVAIFLGFAIWSYVRWSDRPKDCLGLCMGMVVEAIAFAMILWGLGRAQGPALEYFGVTLQTPSPGETPTRVTKAISYLGAGIYEEVLFRLLLYPAVLFFINKMGVPLLVSIPVAVVASSLVFAGAHHLGAGADPVENRVFLFRTLAGVYFCLLYQFRGFGITAGTHAGYDVLVGSAML